MFISLSNSSTDALLHFLRERVVHKHVSVRFHVQGLVVAAVHGSSDGGNSDAQLLI